MCSEENDDFKVVKYHSHRQRKSKSINKFNQSIECYSVDEIINKVDVALERFKESPFFQTLLNKIKEAFNFLNINNITEIICYGLGNFSEHNCPKFQLASLLALKSVYSANVYIYDPLFTKNEIECLKKLNFQVIDNNEEGHRVINNHSTLVYMPHCPKQLTNNFLYANWSPLIHNCILLGNSWSEIECNTTDASLQQNANCLYKLKPFVTELKLKNNFWYPNTFSGTSLHIFLKNNLNKVGEDFWNYKPDTIYLENDPDFIKNSK